MPGFDATPWRALTKVFIREAVMSKRVGERIPNKCKDFIEKRGIPGTISEQAEMELLLVLSVYVVQASS